MTFFVHFRKGARFFRHPFCLFPPPFTISGSPTPKSIAGRRARYSFRTSFDNRATKPASVPKRRVFLGRSTHFFNFMGKSTHATNKMGKSTHATNKMGKSTHATNKMGKSTHAKPNERNQRLMVRERISLCTGDVLLPAVSSFVFKILPWLGSTVSWTNFFFPGFQLWP